MSRRNSRRLLPLASAIFAAGLIGGIMIMVDASGSAGFPAGDAPRPWHAQPADLATHSQLTAAVGSSVSSTVPPATGQVRSSTPTSPALPQLPTQQGTDPHAPAHTTRRRPGWRRPVPHAP